MPRAEKIEWRLEKWPVLLDCVGDDSLLRWPALPEAIEPRVFNDRSEEKWRAALYRDAYQYDSFILKAPEAWMAYRAAMEWHRESRSTPEDFRDREDPDGTVSIKGAEFLCHEQRMEAKRKLAWLGEFIAVKIAANDRKFLDGLARIPKLIPLGSAPLSVQDAKTGGWREWIACSPQEGDVINAIFTFAGRNAIQQTYLFDGSKTPTCREVFDFLMSNNVTISERDIRRIAKRFGVPLAPDKVGRPSLKKKRNSDKKRPPSVP
jgi:hypothetical protein